MGGGGRCGDAKTPIHPAPRLPTARLNLLIRTISPPRFLPIRNPPLSRTLQLRASSYPTISTCCLIRKTGRCGSNVRRSMEPLRGAALACSNVWSCRCRLPKSAQAYGAAAWSQLQLCPKTTEMALEYEPGAPRCSQAKRQSLEAAPPGLPLGSAPSSQRKRADPIVFLGWALRLS